MTWECPECGFDNDDERDMCEECGALRPAGVAPAPSTPAAPVQDFAAPSGERPAPAVYPATSSMGGTPQVQQSASQQVYQSVPVPAPQPAPMPQPAPVPQPMSTPQPMSAPAPQPAAMSIPAWHRTLQYLASMPAFALNRARGWLPTRVPIMERLLCAAARFFI